MSDPVRISLADGTDLITRAFVANGVPGETARCVATALIAAEAEGQAGHGFSRVEDYIAQARTGKIRADAVPVTTNTAPAALLTDAGHGFAYPALEQATEAGIPLAHEMGICSMAVTHSHHCGALSVQVRRIAEAGLVGMMFANAPAAIAPWGAKTPLYGTNPIAFAAPRHSGEPLVIDLSLSKVARGKVMHAHKTGGSIPKGWAFDTDGQPTTDPAEALAGTMAPIGEAKGTALALIVEIFAALLTGASMSKDVSSFFTADGPPPDVGQYLLAIKPPSAVGFTDRLETLLGLIEGTEPARVPGSRRASSYALAQAEGLLVPQRYIASITALSEGGAP